MLLILLANYDCTKTVTHLSREWESRLELELWVGGILNLGVEQEESLRPKNKKIEKYLEVFNLNDMCPDLPDLPDLENKLFAI